MIDLPYKVEYAKSSNAPCQICKCAIQKGTLRIALVQQAQNRDGKQPNWHHLDCLFEIKAPTAINEIANFNIIKHEDQDAIRMKISDEDRKIKRGKHFQVQYSKSNNANCNNCSDKILKNEIRVAKNFINGYKRKFGDPLWYHLKCFKRKKVELNFLGGGEELPGFKSLKNEDQDIVRQEIKNSEDEEVPIKKIKTEPRAEDVKAEVELKQQLVEQSKLYDKSRDALSQFTKNEVHELLQANDQNVLTGWDECLNHLAECMAFGVPEPCPECKGQLVLDTFYYKCTGNMNEWTKCIHKSKDPKKRRMVVPSEYKEHFAFAKYEPEVTTRIFESDPPAKVKKEEPMELGDSEPTAISPLKNLQFFLFGKFKSSKEEIKKRILKLGGLVVTNITTTTAAAVSSKNEVNKMSAKMEELREKDIQVVEETFLDMIDSNNGTIAETVRLIRENNIAEWGNDPSKRIPQEVLDGKPIQTRGSQYVEPKTGTTKLQLKGGSSVDPKSGLAEESHVYRDAAGSAHAVDLSKADVVEQKNSFYKLQILEADDMKTYWLFRSWGRIGTSKCDDKLEELVSRDAAITKFKDLYMEKTKNAWDARDNFKKMPGAYFPVDLDYGEQTLAPLEVDTVKCKLPVPVQQLIMHIFDINIMKQTVMEFELDTDKMPLGKLSRKQIKSGYSVLSELLQYLQEGKANQNKIVDATNRFYTLVPHSLGTDNLPLLDTTKAVQTKTEMLDNLLEIEITYNLLENGPIEKYYMKLKTEIFPLDVKSPEYELVLEYLKNTHAKTHTSYTLDIASAFKVVRDGEEQRYKPFARLHNRRLLWHGSRPTNFAGILSQGLRISPAEAPASGYMFGKGIYFADMVTKSAHYCYANKDNPLGIIILCEVALGNMRKRYLAEHVRRLAGGEHSTWGVGRTQPDPARARSLPDGTLVPLGPPVPGDQNALLAYNEFIVYNVAQVKAKYVLQVRFNYDAQVATCSSSF